MSVAVRSSACGQPRQQGPASRPRIWNGRRHLPAGCARSRTSQSSRASAAALTLLKATKRPTPAALATSTGSRVPPVSGSLSPLPFATPTVTGAKTRATLAEISRRTQRGGAARDAVATQPPARGPRSGSGSGRSLPRLRGSGKPWVAPPRSELQRADPDRTAVGVKTLHCSSVTEKLSALIAS
jgi:hypothetical protein